MRNLDRDPLYCYLKVTVGRNWPDHMLQNTVRQYNRAGIYTVRQYLERYEVKEDTDLLELAEQVYETEFGHSIKVRSLTQAESILRQYG